MFATLILFAILVFGIDTITNNFNCGSLNQEQCGRVLGCWWNSSAINTTVESESDITKVGGRCVTDPCLKIVNPANSCGTYYNQYGTENNCNEWSIGTKTEHWCAQMDTGGGFNYVDCTSTTGTGCSNRTRVTGSATEKFCRISSLNFNCELSALINGGVCRSGTVNFDNQNYTLNCREIDIGGIKVCKGRSGCEALGSNCVYSPSCMIVDGGCVQDECSSQSYNYITGQCGRPETCSGHKVTTVWYNYTYQPSYSSGSSTKYISTERKYSYSWICTNKNYNNNPNPHVYLELLGGQDVIDEVDSGNQILNYPDASGDRCSVARDACKFCPKYKVDNTECTEGGGVVTNVMEQKVCSDGRGPYDSGASILQTPSVILLVFFVVLHYFLN